MTQPIHEGDSWTVVGDRVICRVSGDSVGGAFSIVEIHTPPGGGAPLHVHHSESEIFQVVEGGYEVTVAGIAQLLRAGDMAVGPRGIPHKYRNVGDTVGRMYVTLIPAGFEHFFREASEASAASRLELADLARLARPYRLDFVPDPQTTRLDIPG